MVKWEYHIMDFADFYTEIDQQDEFKRLGNLGWKLISVSQGKAFFLRHCNKKPDELEYT